ncbi:MAG: ABC transporter permease [Oscillospiraceae bacterium]|jgi:simple sugar transport system permease protein|nr:ABC transporter permease [Oscillospiraceae bacterium]
MTAVSRFIKNFGWPRIIILLFLILLFVMGAFYGVSTVASLRDVLVRFGMNGILVLSMVPMVQSGCGLNFGIPVGIIGGLFGAVLSLELRLGGLPGIFAAIGIAIAFALVFGWAYGLLLNRVKGDEMIIATYVGYSFVFLMSIFWLVLPFSNPSSVQGFKGEGLRVTISVEDYWIGAFSKFLEIRITDKLVIPTGMLLFFGLMCLLVWFFFRTKTGTAMTAVGSNPEYARAAGISVNRMRTISVMFSTALAAVGIIVYQQSFGFIQMYNAPMAFVFPSVAAILLGGASVNKASILNVVVGTLLFQGILTMTPSVINSMINIDASEVVRIIVTNGMIVYALTRKAR